MPPPLQVDLLTLKVVSESRVTFATNFSLPRPLCSQFRPDVRDRQTEVRQMSDRQTSRRASSLNASALAMGAGHNNALWIMLSTKNARYDA